MSTEINTPDTNLNITYLYADLNHWMLAQDPKHYLNLLRISRLSGDNVVDKISNKTYPFEWGEKNHLMCLCMLVGDLHPRQTHVNFYGASASISNELGLQILDALLVSGISLTDKNYYDQTVFDIIREQTFRINNALFKETLLLLEPTSLSPQTTDALLQRILSGETFTLKEKRPVDPTAPVPLRRLPRGGNCQSDVWSENTEYTIDKDRTTDEFILFKTVDYPTNWWIDLSKREICYDASSSIQNHTEHTVINNFVIDFPEPNSLP
jgi:hypothetical protein